MNINKPFSKACENNKDPILQVISKIFSSPMTVWEVGSGTGQHACYFAQHLPHIIWQPTDRKENLAGITQWVDDAQLSNLRLPLELDITDINWSCKSIEGLFSANTLHIMSWQEVKTFFSRLGHCLEAGADLCFYGPLNYNGHYTSGSNAKFDQWLKARDPQSGIRDQEAIVDLAACSGIELQEDHAMPANNRLLIWRKL